MSRSRKSIDDLILDLRSDNQIVSQEAEVALARRGRSALSKLIKAARHPDPQVRFRTAWALGAIRDPGAVDALLALTHDQDERVAYDAVTALGSLGDRRAVDRLIELLCVDADEGRSSAAASALMALGRHCVSQLRDVLREGNMPCRIRATLVLARVASHDPGVFADLIQLLSDLEPQVRVAAIEAIGTSGDTWCRNVLESHLDDPDPAVGKTARYWHGIVCPSDMPTP